MQSLTNIIATAWGWAGLSPRAVIDANAFGNIIVQDSDGRYWRICPEELSCEIVAMNDIAYAKLRSDPDFLAV